MKGKKIVSTLLALLLLASLPVSAHAATWDIGKGDITVNAESGGQTVRQEAEPLYRTARPSLREPLRKTTSPSTRRRIRPQASPSPV